MARLRELFSQGNGWDHCQCIHFQRPCQLPARERLKTRAERAIRNKDQKHELVKAGQAHGILVYLGEEPVGWCQYGRAGELPRVDNSPNYAGQPKESETLWRITCFVVHKQFRRHGIASKALEAALAAIKAQGGGIVEAFPLADWKIGSFGNVSTHGTISMFERVGFARVASFGIQNALVRRRI